MTPTASKPERSLPTTPVRAPFSPLLITFLIKRCGQEMQVRCRGCREIFAPADPLPDRFRGLIELDGQPVPVLDATVRFTAEETQISASSCIVVIDRDCESQHVRIGVIVGDIDEVMQLAAGDGTSSTGTGISANMDLVVKMFDTSKPQELLAARHGELAFLHATQNGALALAVQV